MRNYLIGQISSQNGIQRDGTRYFSKAYTDGEWVRFYENVPRKIGGCKATGLGTVDIARSLYIVSQTAGINLFLGRAPVITGTPVKPGSITVAPIALNGDVSPIIDRSPTDDTYDPTLNTLWQFTSGNFTAPTPSSGAQIQNLIFANQTQNDVNSTLEGPIYVGPTNVYTPDNTGGPASTPLKPIYDMDNHLVKASGGILFCAPVLVAYGNNGTIRWSTITSTDNGTMDPGNPSPGTGGSWLASPENSLTITSNKIIHGINTRGSNTPSCLFWSLTSLIRATLIATNSGQEPLTFVSSVVQDGISLMSGNCVVNYEQQVFWIGIDQFYVYNGIVQTLPNTMNNDWFFDKVNTAERAKVWGMAVPRYKEIWWFYPRDTATECNACIIYNVELSIWYDNTLTAGQVGLYPFSRAAGISATGNYPFPIMSDNNLTANPSNPTLATYPIWSHEIGTDLVIGTENYPILSYFTTHLIDLWSNDGSNSNLLRNWRVVPDFLQTGEMSVNLNTYMYPNSPVTQVGPYPFTNTSLFVDTSCQSGLLSFTFTSNIAGGNYQMGKCLYFYEKGDTLK